jgi:hypothetical protein
VEPEVDCLAQSLEERISYMEGKVEEHTRGFGDLTSRIDGVAARVESLDQKVDRVYAQLSARIDALDQKVDRLFALLSARIDALDQKISHQFMWMVGLQVAMLLAVIGALLRNS